MHNIITADQRLALLQSLVACNNDANQGMLQTCIAQFGHSISMDLVRTHMLWLEEQGLIKINRLQMGATTMFVGVITQRGLDVANGVAVVDGVKKPNPEY
ncbi:ArsR family transcriptional regulator [Psychrobacter sp. HD31]|uniref:VpaChn25_0724 family phage protein n=1 Tax=Psychrobacter sp. HD31 TaxID=3112003 RepID=UPI003DA3833B